MARPPLREESAVGSAVASDVAKTMASWLKTGAGSTPPPEAQITNRVGHLGWEGPTSLGCCIVFYSIFTVVTILCIIVYDFKLIAIQMYYNQLGYIG